MAGVLSALDEERSAHDATRRELKEVKLSGCSTAIYLYQVAYFGGGIEGADFILRPSLGIVLPRLRSS